ncbi:MAG: hypothetical protein J6K58_14175 [Lachnospiraceae bacterium]|nr:hypothetical protein [Lachnospiraceae bacterium]
MRDKNRMFRRLDCHISKTIRFDDITFEIIDNYRGSSFSEKLRNYVFDMEYLRDKYNTKKDQEYV